MASTKQDLLRQLQRDILPLQGLRSPARGDRIEVGLGPVEAAFPNGTFPTGGIHDFISMGPEQDAASVGFIAALIGKLMERGGPCVWMGAPGAVFPPALIRFGLPPDKVLFASIRREKDQLWALEEALKCEKLSAVLGEIRDLSFTDSRRLQLAVEKSRVTGFLLRTNPRQEASVACLARWRITPLPTEARRGKPGRGFPRWKVELLKVRNGLPGAWQLEWSHGKFSEVLTEVITQEQLQRKTG